MGRETVQEYVREEVVGDVLEKLDDIRSQTSTFTAVVGASNTFVLNVAAGKVFHIKTLLVTIRSTNIPAQRATLAVGRLWLIRSGVSCGLIANINLGGSTDGAGRRGSNANYLAHNISGFVIIASTVTRFRLRLSAINASLQIGIGGILRDRMAGETTSGQFA